MGQGPRVIPEDAEGFVVVRETRQGECPVVVWV